MWYLTIKEKYLRQECIIFKGINYSILFVNSLQVSCIKISPIELAFSFSFFFLSNDISTLYYANKMWHIY